MSTATPTHLARMPEHDHEYPHSPNSTRMSNHPAAATFPPQVPPKSPATLAHQLQNQRHHQDTQMQPSYHPHIQSPAHIHHSETRQTPSPFHPAGQEQERQLPTSPATGTMSRFKKAMLLRHRRPLCRTWEKASFAEECQSAPASMDNGPASGLGSGFADQGYSGQGRGDLEMQDISSVGHGGGRGQMYLEVPTGLFSPTGRPTSLYSSPAALRAFTPLPGVKEGGDSVPGHGLRA